MILTSILFCLGAAIVLGAFIIAAQKELDLSFPFRRPSGKTVAGRLAYLERKLEVMNTFQDNLSSSIDRNLSLVQQAETSLTNWTAKHHETRNMVENLTQRLNNHYNTIMSLESRLEYGAAQSNPELSSRVRQLEEKATHLKWQLQAMKRASDHQAEISPKRLEWLEVEFKLLSSIFNQHQRQSDTNFTINFQQFNEAGIRLAEAENQIKRLWESHEKLGLEKVQEIRDNLTN